MFNDSWKGKDGIQRKSQKAPWREVSYVLGLEGRTQGLVGQGFEYTARAGCGLSHIPQADLEQAQ